MQNYNNLFNALGLNDKKAINAFSKKTNISLAKLNYYNNENVFPSGKDLDIILSNANISSLLLKLKMGVIDFTLTQSIIDNAEKLETLLQKKTTLINNQNVKKNFEIGFETELGKMYRGDSVDLMKTLPSDTIDMIFADPPFNLDKMYPSGIDDALKEEKYIQWCETWIDECIRLLKPGGSFFLWNLPKWNAILARYISNFLSFKHWITVDIKYSLPVQGRLYPSHYSLLYFVKGSKPNSFHPDRLPLQICPKCFCDIKDYGGYKNKMNPKGINLTDVWLDIPPVRHAKYKRRKGANELSLKLLDRVIEMSTNSGDLIFDPFGGSGTTYMAAELKNRRWLGCELDSLDTIIERFNLIEDERQILSNYRSQLNCLFTDKIKEKRIQKNYWISEDYTV